jgi:hypothetical protein
MNRIFLDRIYFEIYTEKRKLGIRTAFPNAEASKRHDEEIEQHERTINMLERLVDAYLESIAPRQG